MSDARGNDLSLVYAALQAYTRRTGQEPLSPGGWEVEDPAIGPPACLLDRLLSIEPQPKSYAYGKDFTRARERAAEVFQAGMRFVGRPITPEQVVVLQNSSQGLLLALTALREQGVRHAVIAAPTYFATVAICRHLGLAVTLVPAADFLSGALDLPRLVSTMNKGQSALIVTNPAYSVGVEYPPEQLQALFALLPEQSWVLLDETRLGLNWRSDLPWYAADYPPRAIVLRSPSKIFLLNGLKTSFLLGSAAVLRQVETLSEALVGAGAGNAEGVALAYLDAWHAWLLENQAGYIGQMRAWKNGVIERFRLNCQTIRAPLEEQGLALSPVDSGPYLLAAIRRWHGIQLDSAAIARECGVLLMTADYFYHWSEAWLGFRLNLSGDAARSKQAIMRLFTRVLSQAVS